LESCARPAGVLRGAPGGGPGGVPAAWRRDAAHAGGTVRFVSPSGGPARVTILDAQGRRVAEPLARRIAAGPAGAPWGGRDAAGEPAGAGGEFALVRGPWGSPGVRGGVPRRSTAPQPHA